MMISRVLLIMPLSGILVVKRFMLLQTILNCGFSSLVPLTMGKILGYGAWPGALGVENRTKLVLFSQGTSNWGCGVE